MTPPIWQSEEELKEPLDESERGEWKSWLKAQYSENEMASGPITSWQIVGEQCLFWEAPKSLQMVTAAMKLKDACSLEELVLTNLDSILSSRDISFPRKVHLVKAMFFPVDICGFKSGSIKKAGRWRIDTFELWCWRRLLRVPWTARRSNHSIIKQISPEYSLEGLMLKLKLQYFDHLMRRTDWVIGKDPDAGKDWRWEKKGMTEDEMVGWHHWFNGHEFE